MAAKKTIEFTAKNAKNFTNWLKRFSPIDNSLLLEIDEKTSNKHRERCTILCHP